MSMTMSVRPLWKQSALCANNNHRANTTENNSESVSVSVSVEICRTPRGTNNSGRGRPTLTEDRSPGGAEMWHSQETAHDRPHTDSNGVLAWYWESVNPNLIFPTQRNAAQRCRGIPPGFRRRRMSNAIVSSLCPQKQSPLELLRDERNRGYYSVSSLARSRHSRRRDALTSTVSASVSGSTAARSATVSTPAFSNCSLYAGPMP